MTLHLEDPGETFRLGQVVGERLERGALVRLRGPLGAGKTCWVQGLARGLDIPDDAGVRSPSFALVRVHDQGRLPLVHVDLYRLGDPDELYDLGLEEWIGDQAVVAIEWSDRCEDDLPPGELTVDLQYRDDGSRTARIEGSPGIVRSIEERFPARSEAG